MTTHACTHPGIWAWHQANAGRNAHTHLGMPDVCAPPLLHTPNIQSFVEYLKNLTSDVKVVQGDFDEFESPENLVRLHGPTRFIYLLHKCG